MTEDPGRSGAPLLPPEAAELWEINAAWWAEEFTDGADPEYTEQIVPTVTRLLSGARRVLDVGCGEGQISRLARSLPGVDRVVGVDPTWAQLRLAAARGGGVGLALLATLATQATSAAVGRNVAVPVALTQGFRLAYLVCASFV
ncbi:MAG: class I SAM-dependent methyltransferase, partial [Actinomycetota bacterium]|nr:class I SAM-dependent methyltransferase [Actinomycetota bacterium]